MIDQREEEGSSGTANGDGGLVLENRKRRGIEIGNNAHQSISAVLLGQSRFIGPDFVIGDDGWPDVSN